MRTTETSEQINQDRRRLLGTATMAIAAAGAAGLLPAHPATAAEGTAIRPLVATSRLGTSRSSFSAAMRFDRCAKPGDASHVT